MTRLGYVCFMNASYCDAVGGNFMRAAAIPASRDRRGGASLSDGLLRLFEVFILPAEIQLGRPVEFNE